VPAAEEHRGSKFLPEDFDEVVSFDPTTLKVEEGEEDAGDAGEADGGYTADRNPEKDYLASLGGDGDAKEGKGPRGPSIFGGDDSNEFSIPEYYNDEKFAHLNDKQLAQLIQADYEAMTTIADFGNEEGWPITPDGEEEDPEDTRNLGRENEKAWMAHMDQSPTFEEDNQIGHDVDFGLASQYFEPEKMEKDGKVREKPRKEMRGAGGVERGAERQEGSEATCRKVAIPTIHFISIRSPLYLPIHPPIHRPPC
jgi:hypothetical protein